MTIKELEARTGLARANIRYYEQEGLLAPSRLPNGYRDYSEEDAVTLERVKLLRQLHLEIDTIRLVQRGELTLEQALFAQRNRLEGDRAAIDRASEVCQELERAGTTYAALDPKPWLTRPETGARPAAFSPPPKEHIPAPAPLPRAFYPWMRFFARGVDMTIYQTVAYLTVLLRFRQEIAVPAAVNWLLSLVLLAFTFLVEPLWLHFWGWTPGKWLFGLKLRDGNGGKLTLGQAWRRGWRVAWEGCENFNYYLAYLDVTDWRVDESGCWIEPESGERMVRLYAFARTDYADLDLELEDGQVTAVTLTETLNKDPYAGAGVEMEGDVARTIWLSNVYCMAASAAMAGEELDLAELASFWKDRYGDFETDIQGLHIGQTITSSGYAVGRYLYEPIEGENQEYSRTVTISFDRE